MKTALTKIKVGVAADSGTGGLSRSRFAWSLRVVLALFFFSLIFLFVDVGELTALLLRLDLGSISVLALLTVVMIWVSCLKWQVFLRAFGHEVPVLRLMRLYTVGYFFNTFFPSFVGGDVARSYHLGSGLGSQKDAAVSTFLERFTGLLAMSMLSLVFVLFGSAETKGVELAVWLVAAASGLLAAICFIRSFRQWVNYMLERIFAASPLNRFVRIPLGFLVKLDSMLGEGRVLRSVFPQAMFLSLLFHFLTVVNTFAAAWAIGWAEPSLSGLFVVVPLILIVTMVPITPGGLGVQEGAFLFFLKRCGATETQGLGVGLVLRAKVVCVAMVGGLLWLGLQKQVRHEVCPDS
ncbi:MAG: lysylphosphatidylglycerol synthase transmembrane domain-containing protein [bacterium]|nr:lysylphosphatidylglycerol synthase transmembrane domain-containing protein [bacterium]